MRHMTSILQWIKMNNDGLIILLLSMLIGGLLGISFGFALEGIKHPPIQMISINEDALIKEKSLELAKLNLNEAELKKELLSFKHALGDLLKKLPSHVVVMRSTALFRTDNVWDITEDFKALLAKQPEEKKS